ncbi:MAG: hypothetical protein H0X39_20230 [Actinobacteria bacterium]|nr:hypothetical protein [Actinomycetota bacterium]
MTTAELIELLQHEQFHAHEGDETERSYRAGWNSRSRSLIARLAACADAEVRP